jgi:ATP-binding cassette, subfamily F, member 3
VEPPTAGVVELGPGVRVSYFAQHAEETLDSEMTVLDAVLGDRALSPEQVRRVLGRFLFSGESVYKRIADLSGGERRRVALARLVLDRPDLLLLDEPTTHFDLPSLEALEQALAAFEGAMLVASHDRYLLDHTARRLLIVDAGAVREVPGPYHTYRESLSAAAGPKPAVPTSETAPPAPDRTKLRTRSGTLTGPDDPSMTHTPAPGGSGKGRGVPRARAQSSAEADIHGLLDRIGVLEQEQSDLSRLMGDPELYRDAARARETVRRYEEVNAELESLYAMLTAADTRREQAGGHGGGGG